MNRRKKKHLAYYDKVRNRMKEIIESEREDILKIKGTTKEETDARIQELMLSDNAIYSALKQEKLGVSRLSIRYHRNVSGISNCIKRLDSYMKERLKINAKKNVKKNVKKSK